MEKLNVIYTVCKKYLNCVDLKKATAAVLVVVSHVLRIDLLKPFRTCHNTPF